MLTIVYIVGGIPVMELFEINAVPLTVQLTEQSVYASVLIIGLTVADFSRLLWHTSSQKMKVCLPLLIRCN